MLPLADFKALVRDQFYMLLIDPAAAIAALPHMLPDDREVREKALAIIDQVLAAPGGLSGEAENRMQRIAQIFVPDGGAVAAPGLPPIPVPENNGLREAS